MENIITKRMILKGEFPCILTLSGCERTQATIEWLHDKSTEKIYLFSSATESAIVENNSAALPTAQIQAAAIGRSLRTRGQFRAFDWQKAREHLQFTEKARVSSPPPPKKSISPQTQPQTTPEEVLPHHAPDAPAQCSVCAAGEILRENPFPKDFPESTWYRYDYPSPAGGWHYLTGTIIQNSRSTATATAVPGQYSAKPPAWLKEFSKFVYSAQNGQGYWVAISPPTRDQKREEST